MQLFVTLPPKVTHGSSGTLTNSYKYMVTNRRRNMRSQVVRANFIFYFVFFSFFPFSFFPFPLFPAFSFSLCCDFSRHFLSQRQRNWLGARRRVFEKNKGALQTQAMWQEGRGFWGTSDQGAVLQYHFQQTVTSNSTVLLNTSLLETVKQMGRHLPDMKLYMVKW